MEWEIIVHDAPRYVEFMTKGIADEDGSLKMAKAVTHTMKSHRITKVLIDHRHIEDVTGSTTDVYNRPKLFKLIGVILGIKVAEIVRTEHLEHFQFLETVSVNQGYQLSIFQDREEALSWLLE